MGHSYFSSFLADTSEHGQYFLVGHIQHLIRINIPPFYAVALSFTANISCISIVHIAFTISFVIISLHVCARLRQDRSLAAEGLDQGTTGGLIIRRYVISGISVI